MNAGAAIYVGGRADTLDAGRARAEEAIDSGAARPCWSATWSKPRA